MQNKIKRGLKRVNFDDTKNAHYEVANGQGVSISNK
jgi:hypothetical protein